MPRCQTHIGHRVDGEARDPVRDEAGVDEVEDGVEGVPEEVPKPTETPSAIARNNDQDRPTHPAAIACTWPTCGSHPKARSCSFSGD